jgi:hypothetical protein
VRAIHLDLTRLLLWGGAVGLFFVLRAPYAAAGPIAAGESFALRTVHELGHCAAGAQALAAPPGEGQGDAILRALEAVVRPDDNEAARLELLPAVVEGTFLFASRDWLFQLASTPSPPPDQAPLPADAREAWAWPRNRDARVTTVFCTRDGVTLTTRNLTHHYLGRRRAPQPGGWRPRPRADDPEEYWGIDGQYWRLLPRGASER